MAVAETANGVDLAAVDLDGKEAPDSNKFTDLASDATVLAVSDSLPFLRPHVDPNGFLFEDQQLHRDSDQGRPAVAQRSQGAEQEMRDLEELLSKLNPMAEEFVPPSITGGGVPAPPYRGFGVGFGGGFYGVGFGASPALGNGGFDGGGGWRLIPDCASLSLNAFKTWLKSVSWICRLLKKSLQHFSTAVDLLLTVECVATQKLFFVLLSLKGAKAALNLSGTMLGLYPLRVLPSKTAIAPVNPTFLPRSDDEREMCSRTVYCTNIDKKVSQAELRLFFESICGEVYRLRLLGDNHHSTRIAFVEFVRAESATAALHCSGVVLGSLPIRLSPSKTPVRPRSSRPPIH
ncbi:hypothetical protein ZIOFF_020404 [Zingiber officinale]|uniref:RRM domain-containing protein n=1 Tax=Zingiber officinale TaxID=94328 RepID=A0A8J5H7K1_ZINOF|nr:hypothetical protein ZIOFF_020404 [Zingiber officinale]